MNHRLSFAAGLVVVAYAGAPIWSQTTPDGTQTGNEPAPATQQGTEPAQVGGQAQDQTPGSVRVPTRRFPDYGRINQRPWFADPGVREQLRLNENQFNRLNQAYGTAWRRYNQNVTGLGDDLTADVRRQRMQALRDEFDRDFSRARTAVFNDPRIRDRYDQLNYQYRGYGAFGDADLQQRLNLTPQQRRQMSELRDDWNAQMSDIEQSFATDPDTASQRFRDLQMQSRGRLGTVFNPQQQRQWSETIGEPFDFPAETYFDDTRTVRRPGRTTFPDRARR
jgi:hypothetical protein